MILALLQARLSSTRLPGKVLLPLAGAPLLLRQIERVRRARQIDQIVVATSLEASDDRLVQVLEEAGVAVHRGPLADVLARFLGALEVWPADHVVRLTGDCPLIDPEVIDATIDLHLTQNADYTHNRYDPSGYPKGQDVEVIAAAALRRTAAEDHSPEAREHVTWAVRNGPDRYRVARLDPPVDEGQVRWTVDTGDDYEFVRRVYEGLYPGNPAFSSDDVRAFVRARPELTSFGGAPRL
ncbi:glycosyltransferase family protein [Phenylobacterium sp.]|uniref:glycosyltransferase family protein n=1 Tax=Phenylobacterium sp. TaxID=1871053 RepID=UPI002731F2C0|nr:glycosyltransferase family protein [Phenylobacterium sp.]MDP1872939.1 glycosyltransferase family protein [Phenylobacterium sp.]MDP3489855.1 glycosyltransferase family protein [Phenylobacterium sp.]